LRSTFGPASFVWKDASIARASASCRTEMVPSISLVRGSPGAACTSACAARTLTNGRKSCSKGWEGLRQAIRLEGRDGEATRAPCEPAAIVSSPTAGPTLPRCNSPCNGSTPHRRFRGCRRIRAAPRMPPRWWAPPPEAMSRLAAQPNGAVIPRAAAGSGVELSGRQLCSRIRCRKDDANAASESFPRTAIDGCHAAAHRTGASHGLESSRHAEFAVSAALAGTAPHGDTHSLRAHVMRLK